MHVEQIVRRVLHTRSSRGVLVSHARLRQLRQQRVLTQDELAEHAGVARSTVLKLERDDQEARPSTIRKLARVLGVKPEDLLAGP